MSSILKKHSREILLPAKGNCSDQVLSDQMVLGTIMWEAGPQKRRPKPLKAELTQGGPSGSSPLRTDCSCDGQAGVWARERQPKTLKEELEKIAIAELLQLQSNIVWKSCGIAVRICNCGPKNKLRVPTSDSFTYSQRSATLLKNVMALHIIRFSHVIRDIIIISNNVSCEPRVITVRSNGFHKLRVITIKRDNFSPHCRWVMR